MQRIIKKILSFSLAIMVMMTMLVNNSIEVLAYNNVLQEKFEIQNVKGIFTSGDKIGEEESRSINYCMREIEVLVDETIITLTMEINKKKEVLVLEMFPSQFGDDTENRIIGVQKEKGHERYQVTRFVIENSATAFYLLPDNYEMLGNTVVHLSVRDEYTGDKYYFQFEVDNFGFEQKYVRLHIDESDLKEYLMDVEIAYFSMETVDEFRMALEKVCNEEVEKSENSISFDDGMTLEQEAVPFLLIKDGATTNTLIDGIPDELYEKKENGTWTQENNGWNNGTLIGYIVYHMYDAYTYNAMNYVLRYQVNMYYDSDFDMMRAAFTITDNVWVHYNSYDDESYIFDDRGWNARILITPTLFIEATNTEGYFVCMEQDTQKEGTNIYKVSQLILEYVPYLSDFATVFSIATTNEQVSGTKYFESDYVKKVESTIDDLQYSADMSSLTVYGKDVTSVTSGFTYSFSIH